MGIFVLLATTAPPTVLPPPHVTLALTTLAQVLWISQSAFLVLPVNTVTSVARTTTQLTVTQVNVM